MTPMPLRWQRHAGARLEATSMCSTQQSARESEPELFWTEPSITDIQVRRAKADTSALTIADRSAAAASRAASRSWRQARRLPDAPARSWQREQSPVWVILSEEISRQLTARQLRRPTAWVTDSQLSCWKR